MDSEYDTGALHGQYAQAAANGAPGALDWQELRRRMASADAHMPVAKAGKPLQSTVLRGSFDCVSARALAAFGICVDRAQGAVNPTVLGNGKSGYDNDAAVAGAYSTGDRG